MQVRALCSTTDLFVAPQIACQAQNVPRSADLQRKGEICYWEIPVLQGDTLAPGPPFSSAPAPPASQELGGLGKWQFP